MSPAILAAIGTVLQTLLGWGTKALDAKVTERELALQVQLQNGELELVRAKAAGDAAVQQIKSNADIAIADSNGLIASLQADKASYDNKFVDIVRGLVRPVLTVYGFAFVTVFVWEYVDEETAKQAIPLLVTMLVDVTALMLGWWFGARVNNKKA